MNWNQGDKMIDKRKQFKKNINMIIKDLRGLQHDVDIGEYEAELSVEANTIAENLRRIADDVYY